MIPIAANSCRMCAGALVFTHNQFCTRPPERGDKIRRLRDDRTFQVTLVTAQVFTAEAIDGKWSNWGGPISLLRRGETFITESQDSEVRDV